MHTQTAVYRRTIDTNKYSICHAGPCRIFSFAVEACLQANIIKAFGLIDTSLQDGIEALCKVTPFMKDLLTYFNKDV